MSNGASSGSNRRDAYDKAIVAALQVAGELGLAIDDELTPQVASALEDQFEFSEFTFRARLRVMRRISKIRVIRRGGKDVAVLIDPAVALHVGAIPETLSAYQEAMSEEMPFGDLEEAVRKKLDTQFQNGHFIEAYSWLLGDHLIRTKPKDLQIFVGLNKTGRRLIDE